MTEVERKRYIIAGHIFIVVLYKTHCLAAFIAVTINFVAKNEWLADCFMVTDGSFSNSNHIIEESYNELN